MKEVLMNTRSVPMPRLHLGLALLVSSVLLSPLAVLAQPQQGNTATGFDALADNTSGSYNTADGAYALTNNTTGNFNTASGAYALFLNTIGSNNTASGYLALFFNSTGIDNTAYGFAALFNNTKGNCNIANGYLALYNNTTGSSNIANGYQTLFHNTEGAWNTANGQQALLNNTIGNGNTADGYAALSSNTEGISNTANGYAALASNTIGNNNIAIGNGAGEDITTGNNNIAIGNIATNTDDSIIRIGTPGTHQATYIAGINGVTTSGGVAVYINSNGQLGTLTSSQRFKYDIHNLGSVSDKLMDLRPVSFCYKEAASDGSHPLQYGLIAEEVAKVYPEMVQYDKQGKPFTVYYHLLTPLMLNELQQAHRRSDAQATEIRTLKARMASLDHNQQMQLIAFIGFGLAGLVVILATRFRPARQHRAVISGMPVSA